MQAPLQVPSRKHRASRRSGGQALVEFGLVIVLFVLLLSGVFDFGMLINARLSVSSMSRVLARAAAANATQQQLDTLFQQQNKIISVSSLDWEPTVYSDLTLKTQLAITKQQLGQVPSPLPPGGAVKIEVTAQTEVVTPLMRPFFCPNGGQQCLVPITASTTMPVEP
jgi:Flp pilus assembly protein TadG